MSAERFLDIPDAVDERYARVVEKAMAIRDAIEAEMRASLDAMWHDDAHRIASDASEKE